MARNEERTLTIAYFGPPKGGKTTNLSELHRRLAPEVPVDWVPLDCHDPTLQFDLLTFHLTSAPGSTLRIKVYSTPDLKQLEETCRVIVNQADGIVFVADSRRSRQRANEESFAWLQHQYLFGRKTLVQLPIVLQFNKRDLADAIPESEALRGSGTQGVPIVFASALRGTGVLETFEAIVRLTFRSGGGETLGFSEAGLLRQVGLRGNAP